MAPLSVKLLGFVLLLSAVSLYSQRRYVVWTGEDSCGPKGKAIAAEESISCNSVETPRGRVSSLEHDGLSFSAVFAEEAEFIVLAVHIRNATSDTIEFDFEKWGAAHFRSAEAMDSRKKPIAAETAVPYRDLINSARSEASRDIAIDTFMAGHATRGESKRIRDQDGAQTTRTVIAKDEDEARLANSRSQARQVLASKEKESYQQHSLSSKWLAPDTDAKGLVYFRKYDKAGLVIFSLAINGTTYIFRLPRRVD